MNKRIDLTNLGGFPLEEDSLDFMQQSYRGALAALAQLCGDKTILYGCEVIAGNITPGWIAVNGELMPFAGGVYAAQVVITETPNALQAEFEDGSLRDVYFTKVATPGFVGDFDFSELQPLLSFANTWLPGDLKMKVVDAEYEAANFDIDGYGINREKGWRIFSKEVPGAAGKSFVNKDPADATFDTVGATPGSKTATLVGANLPNIQIDVPIPSDKTSTGETGTGRIVGGSTGNEPAGLNTLKTAALGTSTPFAIIGPSFVVLTVIKL